MSNLVFSASSTDAETPVSTFTPSSATQLVLGLFIAMAIRWSGVPLLTAPTSSQPKAPAPQLLPPPMKSLRPLPRHASGSNGCPGLGLHIISGGTLQIAEPSPAKAVAATSPDR